MSSRASSARSWIGPTTPPIRLNDIVDGVKAGFLTIDRIERWASGIGIGAGNRSWIDTLLTAIRSDRLEFTFSQKIGTFITGCRLRQRSCFMSDLTSRYRFELVVTDSAQQEAAFYKRMANDIIFESPQLQQMEHKARRVLIDLWNRPGAIMSSVDAVRSAFCRPRSANSSKPHPTRQPRPGRFATGSPASQTE
jgi:hypothetical protein